jgi:hypothetical protein
MDKVVVIHRRARVPNAIFYQGPTEVGAIGFGAEYKAGRGVKGLNVSTAEWTPGGAGE